MRILRTMPLRKMIRSVRIPAMVKGFRQTKERNVFRVNLALLALMGILRLGSLPRM